MLLTFSQSTIAQERDLSEIEKSETLKVLVWSGNDNYLPRAGSPPNLDKEYIEHFAEQSNLKIEFIHVEEFEDLIPALLAGKGDVIASNMTINPLRKNQIDFTLPLVETTEHVILSKQATPLTNAKDLDSRKMAVQAGTSYALTAIGLARVYPNMEIVEIPKNLSHEQIFDKIAAKEYDLTIIDDNVLDSALMYRDDISKSLQANSAKQIAWAVNKHAKHLKTALNNFLVQKQITINKTIPIKNEWDIITERRTIRFVMRNNISSYYLWKGELMGFHYELARDFAKKHNLRYEIIVAPDNTALLDYVKQGKADIALGFHTPNQHRIESGLQFSRPYHYATEQLVSGIHDPVINSLEDLKYRNIAVRKSSSYWQTVKDLQTVMPEITLTAAPEHYDTERIIEAVATGEFDLTIADNHIVDLEMNLDTKIKPSIFIGKEKAQSWVIKQGSDELIKKIDSYIKATYRGLFYNVIHNKYFENSKLIDTHHDDFNAQRAGGKLSPFDDVVEKYAKKYGFDAKLLIAQMHQESRFNTNAVSYAGAAGLFQVMPRTARELGISNVKDPENGIHAGIKYMAWVQERMEEINIPKDQLIWFSLASYSAGFGHVKDAIRLARQKGWRDDVWFDNVERAMLLLSQRKYSSKARYGYVRGNEPVTYVRNIRHKYQAYLAQVQSVSL